MSIDTRPKRGAWAPGLYGHTCDKCSKPFVGDKRAMVCADCAYTDPGLPCVYCGEVKLDAIMLVSPHTDAIICHECVLQLSQTLVEITRGAKKHESKH